ncbi:diphthine--ammonia ligase [Aristolochia californica]|uniref:diphthine--ammonia ligase n=1 Tax=Aristolochia californica TaxID=171875 RepID=UPI0035E1E105
MKVVALVSGGKDSCYAMMRCIDYGHEIVALANLMPFDDSTDELDSHMYQTVGHQIIVSYAECMELPLFRRRIQGSTRHQQLSYRTTPGDEVEDMFILLSEVKRQIPSITAVSSGAIASDYQRLRVESVSSRLQLISLAYLWKQDQSTLLEEMMRKGIVAVLVKVAALGLSPNKHLGRELADLQSELHELKEKYGINVCGEGGEYETLTIDCPLFSNARILLDDYKIILHSPDSIASVGVLHPVSFHLEYKMEATCQRSISGIEKVGFVHEVQGRSDLGTEANCQLSTGLASDSFSLTDENFYLSVTKRNTFSMGCCIQGPSGTSEGLQRDLTAVLKKVESKLGEVGFSWANVVYVHLYIADMKDFALANETYVRFITENKCPQGVPSRSTIELPLLEVGLGKAYIEVLVASDETKKVLHVQSISCWAPSCIGPYSQATLHKGVLHMAGQLGLDPPTMVLCSGGPTSEMKQALENCEAVANCFSCSLATSAILFVVYCSASLTSSDRAEIQKSLENLLQLISSSRLQNGCMHEMFDPICLFVLASNLPKGALVEVKPVLYAPDDSENSTETDLQNEAWTENLGCWGLESSEWPSQCCQNYIIPGKICSIVVHITDEVVEQLCSEAAQMGTKQSYCSERQLKRIVRFCIYLLDKTLTMSSCSWLDLMNLRFYFTTNLCVTANVLSLAFMEAFDEFAKINQRIEISGEPFFNVIPVLGSGGDASMSDLLTCELFASNF